MVRNRQTRLDHPEKGDDQKKASLLEEDGRQTQRDADACKGRQEYSGYQPRMELASLLEGRGLVTLRLLPHGIDQPYPDVGQGTDRDRMAFALLPLALIIFQGPSFALRGRPSRIDAEHCAEV